MGPRSSIDANGNSDIDIYAASVNASLPPPPPIRATHFAYFNSSINAINGLFQGLTASLRLSAVREVVTEHLPNISPLLKNLEGPMQFTRSLAIAGVIAALPTLWKCFRKYDDVRGMKKFDTVMKGANALGIMTDNFVKMVIGLETYRFSARLAELNQRTLVAVMKTTLAWSKTLGTLTWLLSFGQLALDLRSLWKVNRFLQQFKAGDIKRINSKHLAKNLEAHGKLAREKISREVGINRIENRIWHRKIAIAADSLNFLSIPLIYSAFIPYAGYVCLAGYLSLHTFNILHQKISTYRFENHNGFFDREGSDPLHFSSESTLKNRWDRGICLYTSDFAKWVFGKQSYCKVSKIN